VWAHINGHNMGDDLVVETVLAALKKRIADPILHTVSMYPPGAVERHGVPSWAIGSMSVGEHRSSWRTARAGTLGRPRWLVWRGLLESRSIWEIARQLRHVDVLVIAGSGPLEDDPGSAYRLAKWVMLARLTRSRVAILSVGAGPLERPVNQRLVRLSIRVTDYTSVRDSVSAQLLANIGCRPSLPIRPDMGWGWPALDKSWPRSHKPTTGPMRIGVNVMSIKDSQANRGASLSTPERQRFDRHLETLRTVIPDFLSIGHEVILFSTETNHDVRLRTELYEAWRAADLPGFERLHVQDDTSADGLLATIASCDVVIATRFHACIVSIAAGRPTLGLSYHPKVRDLYESLGVGDLCLDFSTSSDDLKRHVEDLRRRWQTEQAAVDVSVKRFRDAIDEQFDRLVEFTDPTGGHPIPTA
jgi:polysaccharide pyruvyl transferase WcaK-like protein